MWDVIVIGGGPAGLISALAAQSQGKGVLLVSQGAGSLSFASGVFDFGDVKKLAQKEKHPYRLLGLETIDEAVGFFQSVLPEMIGSPGEKHLTLTPLGEARQTTMVHYSMSVDRLTSAGQIVLLQLEGLKDFFADVVELNLKRSFSQAKVQRHVIRPKQFEDRLQQGKALTAPDYRRFWQSQEGKGVWRNLHDSYSESDFVIPGWLHEGLEPVRADSRSVGMSTFPPSAQGNLIYERLLRSFKHGGGEVVLSAVSSAIVEDGHCQGIWLQAKGKNSLYRAKSYILATGGLLGAGIAAEPAKVRERVFGLPLYLPNQEQWAEPEFFGEQGYTRTGVEVDETLHPIHPRSGERLLDNVFVAGRMLAHWDPWSEHCGGGVSITSGYLAGLRA